MQLVNIILSVGLIVLIIGITMLFACTLLATTSGINFLGLGRKVIEEALSIDRRRTDRRKRDNYTFPFSCTDGTTVFADRRSNQERRSVLYI